MYLKLIATLIGAVALGCIVVVTADIISKQKLQQIAKEHNASKLSIKKMLEEGNYTVVQIGLLNDKSQEIKELEVRGSQIKQDFQVGEILVV